MFNIPFTEILICLWFSESLWRLLFIRLHYKHTLRVWFETECFNMLSKTLPNWFADKLKLLLPHWFDYTKSSSELRGFYSLPFWWSTTQTQTLTCFTYTTEINNTTWKKWQCFKIFFIIKKYIHTVLLL